MKTEQTNPVSYDLKLGEYVRSYDFAHRRDCYIEGTIVGFESLHGCERYSIQIARVVFDGQDITTPADLAQVARPPVNGTETLNDDCTAYVERATK